MVQDGDYVAVFNSIHRVMKAEKLLKQRKLNILLIPVPRALQSDCGLAIRYDLTQKNEVEAILKEERLLPAELYLKQQGQFVRVTE